MPLSYNAIEHLQHTLIESCTRARNVAFLANARIDGINFDLNITEQQLRIDEPKLEDCASL